jgi:hypothetical protein
MPTPLPGTAHCAKIALGWLRGGQQLESIFYVTDPTDAIFADPSTFLSAVGGYVISDLLPQMFADLAFNQIGFEDVRTVPFGGLTLGITGTHFGSISATGNMPNSVTMSVKKQTGNLGRAGRGRIYWPSMDASILNDDNSVDSGFAADVITALNLFQADVEGELAGGKVGIVSYYLDKALRADGLFQAITGYSVIDLIVDNMRKRLPGRGR